MKNSILLITILIQGLYAGAQSYTGLEQYCYFGKDRDVSLVTVGYYQHANNWYGELRYNYEDKNTLSLYAGKTFYREGKLSYAATPMLGLLVGHFNGGALGGNMEMTYKSIELSSQVQYIFSKNKTKDFFLNWSELSYRLVSFAKAGVVLQQSTVYRSALTTEAGGFIGFSYKNWELPVYVFNPFGGQRNYVVGISWEWQHNANNKNHIPAPIFKGKKNPAME